MNDLLKNIKNLREITGAGFLDCKKALESNNNDIDGSVDYLRKKGLDPETIAEIMKLKKIYQDVNSDKPVDKEQLVDNLKDVAEDIKKSAEHSRIEDMQDSYESQTGDIQQFYANGIVLIKENYLYNDHER